MKTKRKYIQPATDLTPLESPCPLMAGSKWIVDDEEAVIGQQAKPNPFDPQKDKVSNPDSDSDSDSEEETDSLYQFKYTWD